MSPFVGESASARSGLVNAMEQLGGIDGRQGFFYNTNDLNTAMQRAMDDGAHHYTIGYSPADKTMDGSYRRIEVRLTNGKYKLAYRRWLQRGRQARARCEFGDKSADAAVGFLGLPGATGVLYVGRRLLHWTTLPDSAPKRAGENPALTGPLTRYGVDLVIRTEDVELQPNAQGGTQRQTPDWSEGSMTATGTP